MPPSDAAVSATNPGPSLMMGKRLLLALGVWVLAAGTLGAVTALGARSLGAADTTPIVVAEVYTLLIGALAVAIRPNTARALGLVRYRPADIALAACVCAGAYIITAALQTTIGPWPWSSTVAVLKAVGSDDGRLATAGPAVTAVIIVRSCVLAPLAEEVFFRGALYAWLRQRLSARSAIPISAAAFALIHWYPPILPLAFALGLGFGWVRERSGSTVPTIVVHALHNAVLIGLSYQLTGWTARFPA